MPQINIITSIKNPFVPKNNILTKITSSIYVHREIDHIAITLSVSKTKNHKQEESGERDEKFLHTNRKMSESKQDEKISTNLALKTVEKFLNSHTNQNVAE